VLLVYAATPACLPQPDFFLSAPLEHFVAQDNDLFHAERAEAQTWHNASGWDNDGDQQMQQSFHLQQQQQQQQQSDEEIPEWEAYEQSDIDQPPAYDEGVHSDEVAVLHEGAMVTQGISLDEEEGEERRARRGG
jgi:hypothetical protein